MLYYILILLYSNIWYNLYIYEISYIKIHKLYRLHRMLKTSLYVYIYIYIYIYIYKYIYIYIQKIYIYTLLSSEWFN